MTRAPARRLAEVAKKVGVSEATVSRVLNGKPGVSDSTRETVLTALDVLGYERPSKLRGQRARLIGLVLPELQNPIFPALAEVIGGALAQRGFTPVLCTLHRRRPVRGRLRGHAARAARVRRRVRRRATSRSSPPRTITTGCCGAGAFPVVLINALVDNLGFPCVSTDDASAAVQAFGHLSALGHDRIGLVLGPEDHMPSRRKLAAFTASAERAGISVAPVEHALFSLEGGQAATTRMLRQGVTGIICASDVLALGAIRAVRRAGLTVPGDVSVVGFDDSAWLNCIDPPLTTVRQPIESMGKVGRRPARQPDGDGDRPPRGAAVRARACRPRLHRPRPRPRGVTCPYWSS